MSVNDIANGDKEKVQTRPGPGILLTLFGTLITKCLLENRLLKSPSLCGGGLTIDGRAVSMEHGVYKDRPEGPVQAPDCGNARSHASGLRC
jgi:hypothetical protein